MWPERAQLPLVRETCHGITRRHVTSKLLGLLRTATEETSGFVSEPSTRSFAPYSAMLRNSVQRVAFLSRLLVDQLGHVGASARELHTSASSANALAASEAWNFSPRDACLAGTRGVVRLGGNDVIHFLQAQSSRRLVPFVIFSALRCLDNPRDLFAQGLLTNDVAALEISGAKPLYACILNAQGRVLHDMFLYRQAGVLQRWIHTAPSNRPWLVYLCTANKRSML